LTIWPGGCDAPATGRLIAHPQRRIGRAETRAHGEESMLEAMWVDCPDDCHPIEFEVEADGSSSLAISSGVRTALASAMICYRSSGG
jgi:hypothetical protein